MARVYSQFGTVRRRVVENRLMRVAARLVLGGVFISGDGEIIPILLVKEFRVRVLPFLFWRESRVIFSVADESPCLLLFVYVAFDYAFAVSSHGFAIVSRRP